MEATRTTQMYASDLEKIESMMKEKNIELRRDALRICIEYAQAHGVFS